MSAIGDKADIMHRELHGPRVTWPASYMDRELHGPRVTWTASYMDRELRLRTDSSEPFPQII
jgi:hypothetical protein